MGLRGLAFFADCSRWTASQPPFRIDLVDVVFRPRLLGRLFEGEVRRAMDAYPRVLDAFFRIHEDWEYIMGVYGARQRKNLQGAKPLLLRDIHNPDLISGVLFRHLRETG